MNLVLSSYLYISVEHLPIIYEAMGSLSSTNKRGRGVGSFAYVECCIRESDAEL